MKILAIIPAKKTPKELKNKNKILLKNKKLIEHTFLVAQKSKLFTKILLTTDDKEIIRLSKRYGILAPWVRPKKLSDYFSPSYKAVIHAYDWYKKILEKLMEFLFYNPRHPSEQ